MSAPILYVLIFSDVEPDSPEISGQSWNLPGREPSWLSVEKAVPAVVKVLDDWRDDFGQRPRVTWCVRADYEILSSTGRSDYMFRRFASLWEGLRAKGHEIAWHPHYLRRNPRDHRLEHTCDAQWERQMLIETYAQVRKYGINCVRMGLNYMDAVTMSTLNELGVTVEATAQPGLYVPASNGQLSFSNKVFKKVGNFLRGGNMKNVDIDWRGAPGCPYFPASNDYRRPNGRDCLKVLEIPCSMLPARHPLMKTSYTAAWNILHPQPNLRGLVVKLCSRARANGWAHLSGYFHPTIAYDELWKHVRGWRRAYLRWAGDYLGVGVKRIPEHMKAISATAKAFEVRARFITASEFRDVIRQDINSVQGIVSTSQEASSFGQ